jgi:polysaccharide biosynthesis/export protein
MISLKLTTQRHGLLRGATAAALVALSLVSQVRAQTAPAAAPTAAAQYRLALGDTVRITVFQNADLSLETRITEGGSISYPLLGAISLAGLTVTEAEQKLARGLRDGNFVKQPQVSINVVTVRGNQVSVLGLVGRPGRYPLETGEVRLTDLIATAGGVVTGGGDLVVVVGTRKGQPYRVEVDLPTVFAPNRRNISDVMLENGDVVWVERAPTFYLYGEVQRPGALRLERNMTVMQALASAGGLSARGTLRGLRVSRKDAEGRLREIEPQLTDLLKPDDVVFVRESVF